MRSGQPSKPANQPINPPGDRPAGLPAARQASRPVRSLADQVYERLRRSIVSGELPPEARIVELDIARQMGTSQGPVREALQRLEREGLVQRQAHSATFVTPLVLDVMYELFSIRSVIEGFAIRHTVESITPEQCDQLAHLTDLMREEGAREDMLGLTVYDMEFHRQICKWSGNATLLRAWDPLYSQIQRFVVRTHRHYFASVTDVADTHIPIVDALRRQDREQVTPLIQEHIMLIWSLFARGNPKGGDGAKEPNDATDGSHA
jgi:DNA-binding GntR family transcriptional regulator